jgi:hypothetical protein
MVSEVAEYGLFWVRVRVRVLMVNSRVTYFSSQVIPNFSHVSGCSEMIFVLDNFHYEHPVFFTFVIPNFRTHNSEHPVFFSLCPEIVMKKWDEKSLSRIVKPHEYSWILAAFSTESTHWTSTFTIVYRKKHRKSLPTFSN